VRPDFPETAKEPAIRGPCGCVSVSAKTISGLKMILGGLSLGRGIPFPRCRSIQLGQSFRRCVKPPAPGASTRYDRQRHLGGRPHARHQAARVHLVGRRLCCDVALGRERAFSLALVSAETVSGLKGDFGPFVSGPRNPVSRCKLMDETATLMSAAAALSTLAVTAHRQRRCRG
jgi:hypothetical protein